MSDLFRTGPGPENKRQLYCLLLWSGRHSEKDPETKGRRRSGDKANGIRLHEQRPRLVSKGIREHYGVDTAAIKDAAKKPKRGRTSIRVAGISVDGATLEYKGRTLTPIHFKMSPKARPSAQQKKPIRIPGQLIAGGSPVAMVRPPRKYTVKVTIIKGQRTAMSSDTFLTAGKGGPSFHTSAPERPLSYRGSAYLVRATDD